MKKVAIGMLGLGNVGTGVYRILSENRQAFNHREGLDITVKKILVRDRAKPRGVDAPAALLTEDFAEIANDPEISIVAEFMGGIHPAREYIIEALKKGKTVVTANKEVVSKHWPELESAAKEAGVGLYYEASVAGGIPIIRSLFTSLQANNIDSIMGIINGTTNFILTKMSQEERDYNEVLAEAQALGYAEPDPTNDVEGLDAVYKLSILASIAFHGRIPVEEIYHEGITKISAQDIKYCRELGYVIKLLAIGKKNGTSIEARVHPTMIPQNHPLAAVLGAYNAVFVHGHAVGDLMFYGRGAGDMPTGSAVVSDIINAAKTDSHIYTTFVNKMEMNPEITINRNWETGYYINIKAPDKPGVLAKIAGALGKHGVSIASVMQKEKAQDGFVPVIFITHKAFEQDMEKALEDIRALPDKLEITSLLRVEE